jgi:hypothetical protein
MHITADSIVRARIDAIILALIGILPFPEFGGEAR